MLLLTGCNMKHDPLFDQLESRVSDSPDSVRTVLESIDPSDLHDDFNRSRHIVLFMMAQAKCRVPLQSDSAIYKAVEYFHKTEDPLNEAKARYYAGLSERQADNYQAAIREALHSIDRAHEAADTFWMGRAHDLAYEVYISTYDCRNAAIEADKAAVYFKHASATPFHRYALLEKAHALNYPVKEDGTTVGRGTYLLDSLKNVAIMDRDSGLVASCLNYLAFHSFQAKDYELAMARTDSIRTFSDHPFFTYTLLPHIISMKIEQGQSPIESLKEYEEHLTTLNDTIGYLNSMIKYKVATNDWKAAYNLLDSLHSYYNDIMTDKILKSVDEIKEKYDKEIIEEKQTENTYLRSSRTVMVWVTLGAAIVFLILLMLLRSRSKHKEESIMGQLFEIATENENLKTFVRFHDSIVAENKAHKEEIQENIQKQNNIMAENKALKENLREIIQNHNDIQTENKILKEKLLENIGKQNTILTQNEDLKSKIENYDKILSENLQLKEQLQSQVSDFEQKLKIQEENIAANVIELSQKQSNILGNKIDTLCNLAMEYYNEDNDCNKAFKNEIYHKVSAELRELKSDKFLKNLERRINETHNNILTRFQAQLPKIAKDNMRWIALVIGGIQPRTISFLLDMNIRTLYSKRARVRSYIEKSDAPNKREFLLFFPKTGESD